MDYKKQLIGWALSASLGVAGSALTTWKQVGELRADLDHTKLDLADARATLRDHQEDISKMYSIDGKLTEVVDEIKSLRKDIQAINSERAKR